MTVQLDLTPEIEKCLLAQARANGLSLEAYAARVLQERSKATLPLQTDASAKARAFEQWARSHPSMPPLPAEAFQRESLIRDAG